ncbi:PREDICTED: transposon [Prunus dulcis]|uniref:PREDICTED: transposon n=1 Tax=Prunus dulcis TaxID=3755 RepID=A0A5E4GJN6_PRUDU|nr:PREDICTED: transposon [Prunus dulcis]
MFEECIDNPIEEEPEEMGYAGEISDDVQNSEDLHSKQDSDDECDENGEVTSNRRKINVPNFRQWRREAMLKNPTFDIGMHFANKTVFKEAVQHYTCMVGCPFVIFASRIDDSPTMVIKTLNLEHECSRDQRNYWLNSTFFAQRYANQLRADPDWSVPGFTAAIQRDFGLEPSMQQIYRAKLKATKLNKGSFVEQFHKLHDYCEELKRANPGSTVLLKTEMDGDQRRFHRLYICLEACKTGFLQGCRPVIGMDGCFIKGPHPGQLLAAVGIDGNNGMFPLAYAVVEIENKETWEWFIRNLIADLAIENGHGYAFISDKQKGLGLALGDLLPNAEHRHCVRHFYNNFKTSHSGLTLKQIMWDAARATTIPWWQCHMERMKQESEVAWKWLHPKSAVHWSRSHFRTQYKCDILLNNLCEAFNSSILKARDKPILSMLEGIRTNLMVRMANRRVAAWKWKRHVGPRIEQIMEKNKLEAGYCIPTLSGDMKYQVTNMHGGQFAVDLAIKTCSCKRWDLCGLPCPHAISCILRRKHDPYSYVDECYKREAYLKCYNPIISPMPSMDQWLSTGPHPLLPPLFKKQTGRPRKKRAREQGDPLAATKGNKLSKWVHVKFSCSKCGQAGHNKKTCGKSTSQQVARGGRKMQQSRSNSNAPTGTSISQPSLAVVRFSQPSPAPQVASQPPTAHNSSSQQASTSQTIQRRKLKSPAKKGRPWRV